MIATMLLLFSFVAQTSQITVAWDPNSETDLAGYKVHVGQIPGSYNEVFDVGNNTIYSYNHAVPGVRYYFAVTAYNTATLESPLSVEISTVLQPQVPCAEGAVKIAVGTWTRNIAKNGTGLVNFSLTQSANAITTLVVKLNNVEQGRVTAGDLRMVAALYYKAPAVAGSYQLSVEAFDAQGCTDLANRPMTVNVK
jgi:chitinase